MIKCVFIDIDFTLADDNLDISNENGVEKVYKRNK